MNLKRNNKSLEKPKLFQALLSGEEYRAVVKDIKERGITRRVYVVRGLSGKARKDVFN